MDEVQWKEDFYKWMKAFDARWSLEKRAYDFLYIHKDCPVHPTDLVIYALLRDLTV